MEQTLGKRIVANRKRMKLTQDQLAEQLGVTAQAVSKWENDQSCPDIAILPRLAEIFGISTDELLGREAPIPSCQGEVVDEEESDGIHMQKGGWEFRWDSGRRDALALAIWVLLVGALALAGQFLSWDANLWDIMWPSFLLIFGLSGLFRRFSVFRIGMVLVGGYYLVHNLDIWTLNIHGNLVWPALILLFGLGLLIDAFKKPKKNRFHINHRGGNTEKTESSHNEDGEHFESTLSFGDKTYIVNLSRLASGYASVSFGDLTIDLTSCEEIVDGCDIDVKCSFGELVLLVPKHCKVVVNSGTSFADVDYIGRSNPDADTTIYVDGSISFGELSIRYV